jgi:inner membrane protease ATP23
VCCRAIDDCKQPKFPRKRSSAALVRGDVFAPIGSPRYQLLPHLHLNFSRRELRTDDALQQTPKHHTTPIRSIPDRPVIESHANHRRATMANSETAPDGASLSAMAQPPPQKIDPVYYTWSSTFSIMLGRMTNNRDVELEKGYFGEMDKIKADSICKRCESNKDYLLKYSPTIRFLSDEVYKLGGDLNKDNILCRICTNEQSGGFSLDHGILLCANKFRNRGHQEDTMAHEMVHAWDHLKFKVEPENLRHQACLEIRASTLSGECRFSREFFTRNQWRITEQLQSCVRRRATLSMMARPGIKDQEHAGKVVNEVWESCFRDARPFDEIYR